MGPTLNIHGLSQLLDWATTPGSPPTFSPFGADPCLLFEADGAGPPAVEQARIADWLRQLPCPTLGIATEAGTPLAQACDVLVASAAEAAPLVENIRRNPVAASVLVQTLRLTENLPVLEALDVESLAYATLQGGAEFKRWLEKNRAASPAVPTDTGPAVIIQRRDDSLLLELNRASNRNALNVEMRDALVEALQLVLADDSIRVVKLSGRGKCFSVGGDLTEFGSL
ncbi:MAG TPA: enoyl-CoA hydratase/isomerase family protein, partial [Nevskiales bacterium]|nr:enoyl-CoA hydratase/isomerase family protein [Nevskiales bacterium]